MWSIQTARRRGSNNIATVGCDNSYQYIVDGTDDQVEIQQAIDALYARGGGIVLLGTCSFNITSAIIVKEGVYVQGSGKGTVLTLRYQTSPYCVFQMQSNTGLYNLVVDGNKNNIPFQDSRIEYKLIRSENADNVVYDSIEVRNARAGASITNGSGTNIYLLNSYVHDNGHNDDWTTCGISDSVSVSKGAIYQDGNGNQWEIVHDKNPGDGETCLQWTRHSGSTGMPQPGTLTKVSGIGDATIAYNEASNTNCDGMWTGGSSANFGPVFVKNCRIQNNKDSGIALDGINHAYIIGNRIDGCHNGVSTARSTNNVIVMGNSFDGNDWHLTIGWTEKNYRGDIAIVGGNIFKNSNIAPILSRNMDNVHEFNNDYSGESNSVDYIGLGDREQMELPTYVDNSYDRVQEFNLMINPSFEFWYTSYYIYNSSNHGSYNVLYNWQGIFEGSTVTTDTATISRETSTTYHSNVSAHIKYSQVDSTGFSLRQVINENEYKKILGKLVTVGFWLKTVGDLSNTLYVYINDGINTMKKSVTSSTDWQYVEVQAYARSDATQFVFGVTMFDSCEFYIDEGSFVVGKGSGYKNWINYPSVEYAKASYNEFNNTRVQTLDASTALYIDPYIDNQIIFVEGDGGAVTTSQDLPDGGKLGQVVHLVGYSSNTWTLPNGQNCALKNGKSVTLGANDRISLIWNGSDWIEMAYDIRATELEHNELDSIQGGAGDERYHLTLEEYSNLVGNTLLDRAVIFSDDGALQTDSDLIWDNINKRLGIGTNSPGNTLQVGDDGDLHDNYIEIAATGAYSKGILFTRIGITDTSIVSDDNEDLILHYMQSDLTGRKLKIVRGSSETTVAVFDESGKIGIGTNNPSTKFYVNVTEPVVGINAIGDGSIAFTNPSTTTYLPTIMGRSNNNSGLMLMGGTSDTSGSPAMRFDIRDSNNTDFSTKKGKAGFRWTRYGTNLMTLYRSGKLYVAGKIKVGDDVEDPVAGDIRFNSSTNKHQAYDGTTWHDLY